jgi:hypothetical protein
MSYDTHKTWLYRLEGRYIHLWQYIQGAATTTLGDYKIRLPGEYYGNQLIYPNEDITNGLRFEYTALIEPFVDEAWEDLTARASSSTISFGDGDGGSSRDTINYTSGLGDFDTGDKVRLIGSASNDGDYVIANAASSSILEVAAGSFATEAVGQSITVYQIPDEDTDPDETNHVNLNRLLSLSVVDYLKAQLADMQGNVQMKEYYMREFWKKVGDNESNKRKISMTFPTAPFAVR